MTPPTATLVGLDFGTTTSSAIVATAEVRRNAVSGRMELAHLRETFRSPLVFTPIADERLDLATAVTLLDGWLAAGGVNADDLLGGGALLTGLTARRDNAAGLVAAIRERLGPALVATADDPCLESWLAFQGSCGPLSRRHPDRWFLHVDIGGGTANLALGRDGEVHATGCLFVGGRHVRLVTGTRRIEALSPHARRLLRHLGLDADVGDELAEPDVTRIVDWHVDLLERAVTAAATMPTDAVTAAHVQVPLEFPSAAGAPATPVITLSGGVGELVYAAAAGRPLPGTAAFGDLGIDLARRLLEHPRLGHHWQHAAPDGGGRATVIGLVRHSVQLSGTSLHLPDRSLLPLRDLPIVGTFASGDDEAALHRLLDLAKRSPTGAGLRLTGIAARACSVTDLGDRIARALVALAWPPDRPLVLLVSGNVGKALGQCATRWGRLDVPLVAIDELDLPDARWATLGTPRDHAVPVSFFGLRS